MEQWRKIEGTHGLLEVSDLGRVKSLMRDGRILKASEDAKGYLRIHFTVMRERKSIKVHREVAKAFLPNPHNLPQVNHVDGDKKNNAVDNLEWVSGLENARHAMRNGLWRNNIAATQKANNARKTPIKSVDSVTGETRYFESVREAERFFNTRHISDVLNGKRERAASQYFSRIEVSER